MADPKNPKVTEADIKLEQKQANQLKKVMQAFKTETRAIDTNTKSLEENIRARKKLNKADNDHLSDQKQELKMIESLTKAQGKLGDNIRDVDDSLKRQKSGLEKAAAAANILDKAVGTLKAGYKAYVVLSYDAIRASNMMMRTLRTDLPKGAIAAQMEIDRLAKRYTTLRTVTTETATKYVVAWDEAAKDVNSILETLGMNLDEADERAIKRVNKLQERMYATRTLTGRSVQEQLQDADEAINNFGATAEDFMDTMEETAKSPFLLQKNLKLSYAASLKYKDLLRGPGFLKSVQDLTKSMDDQKNSVQNVAKAYGYAAQEAIKFGMSQRSAQEFAKKVSKGLLGAQADTGSALNVQDYLTGQSVANKVQETIRKQGKGQAIEDVTSQFAERSGANVEDLKKKAAAGGDEGKQAAQQLEDLAKQATRWVNLIEKGTEADRGAIGSQFAGTDLGIQSRLEAAMKTPAFASALSGNSVAGIEGSRLISEQVLGVKDLTQDQLLAFQELLKEQKGQPDQLAKKIKSFGEDIKKAGPLTAEEKSAAETIENQKKLAEIPDILAKNLLGPKGALVDIAAQQLDQLVQIHKALRESGVLGGAASAVGAGGGIAGAAGGAGATLTAAGAAALAGGTAAVGAAGLAGGAAGAGIAKLIDDSSLGDTHQRTFAAQDMNANVDQLQALLDKKQKSGGKLSSTEQATLDVMKAKLSAKVQQAEDAGFASFANYLFGEGDEKEKEDNRAYLQNADKIKSLIGKDAKPHASGLDNVPYDNYLALLHKDEAVLTKRENEQRKDINFAGIQRIGKMSQDSARAPSQSSSSSGGSYGGDGAGQSAISNGKLTGTLRVQDDKLILVMEEASSAVAQLLERSKQSSPFGS